MSSLHNVVTSLYPDALTRTYCVPPVHFCRVPYVRQTVPGTSLSALALSPPSSDASTVQKDSDNGTPAHSPTSPRSPPVSPTSLQPGPQTPHSLWTQESKPEAKPVQVLESDFRDDFAVQHVLCNLQELGRQGREPMLIMSPFKFDNYLNKPAYAAAVARFPKPIRLHRRRCEREGESDVLAIHRHKSILIGEIKSIGQNQLNPPDSKVHERVNKAVKQLDKSERMVRHLLKDIVPDLMVQKTIFLPYISQVQLRRVLSANNQLKEAVCDCLDAANAEEAIQLCCCPEQLSHPDTYRDVTPAVLSKLTAWWQRRMTCIVKPQFSDQLYLEILARFVGPASTVEVHCSNPPRLEVRTDMEAILELGRRMARLVLTLQQLDILKRDLPLVCLTGPPGTGKTLLLVLQGLRWLEEKHDVFVVSTRRGTLAISHLVKNQIEMTFRANSNTSATPSKVHMLQYDFYNCEQDVHTALEYLSETAQGDTLHVLLDEAEYDTRSTRGKRLTDFVGRLIDRVPKLHLWAAGVRHTNIPPQLTVEVLTTPLRSAPVVLQEVRQGLEKLTGQVHQYTDSEVPAPGDGLRVVQLVHHGGAHTGRWPHECAQCGADVAAELHRLGVGQGGDCIPYKDVFVLTRSFQLQDEVRNDARKVTSLASGVVQGLRNANIPVCVLGGKDWETNRANWESDVADTAEAKNNEVAVAWTGAVGGLERKIVVALSGRTQSDDEKGLNDEEVDAYDRIYELSRCTTHLITVTVPTGP